MAAAELRPEQLSRADSAAPILRWKPKPGLPTSLAPGTEKTDNRQQEEPGAVRTEKVFWSQEPLHFRSRGRL